MRIRGAEHLTDTAFLALLDRGAEVRCFDYCLSIGLLTIHRQSEPVLIPPGRWDIWDSWTYSLITLVAGGWGVPWGIVLTPMLLWSNFCGGRDLTATVRQRLRDEENFR